PRVAHRAHRRRPVPAGDLPGLRDMVPGPDAQGRARSLAGLLTMGIENLLLGFHIAITPYNLFVAVVGITLGTVIGVLPGLGGANPVKSLVTILLGFLLAAVGLDVVTGQLRMTFGVVDLMKGFDFIVAVIGLFGIGEILLSVEEGLSFRSIPTGMNLRVVLDTW